MDEELEQEIRRLNEKSRDTSQTFAKFEAMLAKLKYRLPPLWVGPCEVNGRQYELGFVDNFGVWGLCLRNYPARVGETLIEYAQPSEQRAALPLLPELYEKLQEFVRAENRAYDVTVDAAWQKLLDAMRRQGGEPSSAPQSLPTPEDDERCAE